MKRNARAGSGQNPFVSGRVRFRWFRNDIRERFLRHSCSQRCTPREHAGNERACGSTHVEHCGNERASCGPGGRAKRASEGEWRPGGTEGPLGTAGPVRGGRLRPEAPSEASERSEWRARRGSERAKRVGGPGGAERSERAKRVRARGTEGPLGTAGPLRGGRLRPEAATNSQIFAARSVFVCSEEKFGQR